MSQAFDARRRRVVGEAVPFVEDVWWDGISTLATAFSASSGGVIAYQTGGLASTRLLQYDRSGREVGTAGPPGAYFEPTLSPDGRWLAVSRAQPGLFGTAIWMIDLARGSSSRVSLQRSSIVATPLWSPDGRRIIYCAFPSGKSLSATPTARKRRICCSRPPRSDLWATGRGTDGSSSTTPSISRRSASTSVCGNSRPGRNARFSRRRTTSSRRASRRTGDGWPTSPSRGPRRFSFGAFRRRTFAGRYPREAAPNRAGGGRPRALLRLR